MSKMGITWSSNQDQILQLPPHNHNFVNLRAWADSYDALQVWTRLNTVVALASTLETYIDTICGLAIESNPGVLINSSQMLDGVKLLKNKRLDRELITEAIKPITRNEWCKRKKAFESLFGGYPPELDIYESELEQLRKKRNDIGHAFGRNINKVRKFEEAKPLPLEGISEKNLLHFFDITMKVAQGIDSYLMDYHIGEYQTIFAFHVFKIHTAGKKWDKKSMTNEFRKQYVSSSSPLGKQFFLDLADYYDSV